MLKKVTFLLAFLPAICLSSIFGQQESKIILSPFNTTVQDAIIGSIIPDENRGYVPGLNAYSWTQAGSVNNTRALVQFDFSLIPQNGEVLDAKLVVYFDPFSITAQLSHMGNSGFYVNRIVEPWEELGVTWNNQPETTTDNQVYVPFPTYNEQNFVIDVTDIVNDIRNDPNGVNGGFMLTLESEFPYNAILLCSKENADISRHPKLLVTFAPEMSPTHEEWTDDATAIQPFTLSPNPASGEVVLTAQNQDIIDGADVSYRVVNSLGQQVISTTKVKDVRSVINTRLLPAGTYFVVITSKDQKVKRTIKFEKV